MPLNLTLYLKIGAVVITFLGGWFANGWRLGEDIAQMQAQAAVAAKLQTAAVLSIERLSAERSAAVSAQAAAEAREQVARAQVITRTVIEYVQDPNTGKCDLPNTWVQAHNQATGNGLPPTTPAAGASTTAASRAATDRDALIAVTDNYNRCRANIVQLRGLIEWARGLKAQL